MEVNELTQTTRAKVENVISHVICSDYYQLMHLGTKVPITYGRLLILRVRVFKKTNYRGLWRKNLMLIVTKVLMTLYLRVRVSKIATPQKILGINLIQQVMKFVMARYPLEFLIMRAPKKVTVEEIWRINLIRQMMKILIILYRLNIPTVGVTKIATPRGIWRIILIPTLTKLLMTPYRLEVLRVRVSRIATPHGI